MADRQGDASVSPQPASGRHPAGADTPPAADHHVRNDTAMAPLPCAECGFPRPTLVSDGEMVSVFKCPRCGDLSAPVKGT